MINLKLVSSSVALLLMAVPLATPPSPKAAQPKPINLDQSDTKLAFVLEQSRGDDLIERQLLHPKPTPPPPPPPPPAPPKPISPYAVRPVTVAYKPYNVRAVAVVYPGAVRNHFSYGYCTYWVATRRVIPWFGDANQWVWNAIAFGYRTGVLPVAGAVMAQGNHVAFVERINGDGSFTISEMNWWGVPGGGWNRVDYRTLFRQPGMVFIY